MAKIIKTISIDAEVNQRLKLMGTNVSGLVNNFLRCYIELPDNMETTETKEKLLEAETKLTEVRSKLIAKKTKEEQEAKEKEKERLELTKCDMVPSKEPEKGSLEYAQANPKKTNSLKRAMQKMKAE